MSINRVGEEFAKKNGLVFIFFWLTLVQKIAGTFICIDDLPISKTEILFFREKCV